MSIESQMAEAHGILDELGAEQMITDALEMCESEEQMHVVAALFGMEVQIIDAGMLH